MHYNDCTAPLIFALFAWMYPSATFLKLHAKCDSRLPLNTVPRHFFQSQLVCNETSTLWALLYLYILSDVSIITPMRRLRPIIIIVGVSGV